MRALLLSCGPSLNSFDGNTAGYDVVIGVNDVVSRHPCDWWVFGDDETITRNMGKLAGDVRKLFAKRKPIHHGFDARCGIAESDFFHERYWRLWHEMEDWPRSMIRHSGVAALVLAADLGAREVDVWGVDLGGTAGFDDDGAHAIRTDERWNAERVCWDVIQRSCENDGIRVNRSGVAREAPLFTTFHTGDGPYVAHAEEWEKRVVELGMKYRIGVVELADPEWWKRSRYKPTWILNELRRVRDREVWWVDVDSEIVKPLASETSADIALVEYPENLRACGRYSTAVVRFSNTEKVREFVAYWAGMCRTAGKTFAGDQEVFEVAVETFRPRLDIEVLPAGYAWMDAMPEPDDVFVRGLQASRKVRTCR